MSPIRIQRRRVKGWRAPENAVYVGRGSGFGNAWKIGSTGHIVLPGGWIDRQPHPPLTRQQAVDSYRNSLTFDIGHLEHIRARLAGKDLMCWCPLGEPCHADFLLEVANSTEPVTSFLVITPKPGPRK